MRSERLGESPMGVVKMKNEGDLKYLWLTEQRGCPMLDAEGWSSEGSQG